MPAVAVLVLASSALSLEIDRQPASLVHPTPKNALRHRHVGGSCWLGERAHRLLGISFVLIYQHSRIHMYIHPYTYIHAHTCTYMHILLYICTRAQYPYIDWILLCVTSHSRSGVPFFRQHDAWLAYGNGQRRDTLLIAPHTKQKGTKSSRAWGDSEPTSVHMLTA